MLALLFGLMLLPAAGAFGQGPDLRHLQKLTVQSRDAYRAGNLIGALALARRVAEGTRQRLGERHLSYVQALNNVALLLDLNGLLTEAAATYRHAIAIVDRLPEGGQAQLADLKNNLAAVALQRCQLREAQGLYADALALTAAAYGSYHRETELVRANLERLDRFAAGKASAAQSAAIGALLSACVS